MDITREMLDSWWKAPHCGSGSKDPHTICGFCGEESWKCARATSEFYAEATEEQLRQQSLSEAGEADSLICGGGGFWCPKCSRFWAEDSCGNSIGVEHQSSTGEELRLEGEDVYCPCGFRVMKSIDPATILP
jgi:hypothetical protein